MNIAIVGATGEVGRMMIRCLAENSVPVDELVLFASPRSAGSHLYYMDQPIEVHVLEESSLLRRFDYVLFSAGTGIARTYAPLAVAAQSVVIDNSSAFRQEQNIPLVVPEINGDLIQSYQGIIANPNCSTIQMVLPLAVLHDLYGLRKVIVTTLQAVSGSGNKGIQTLMQQRKGDPDKGDYPEIIDLNVIPQIGALMDDGYCKEEEKMHHETRKILDLPDLPISATSIRVPVVYGHSISVYAEFEREISLFDAESALKRSPSIFYHPNSYLTPRDIDNSNDSHVSRLRYGPDRYSLCFWNVGHNVRLGAATNAVRILVKHAVCAGRMENVP